MLNPPVVEAGELCKHSLCQLFGQGRGQAYGSSGLYPFEGQISIRTQYLAVQDLDLLKQ